MADDFIDTFYRDREFSNFGAMLFRLIAKADINNCVRISKAFSLHTALYWWWMGQATPPEISELRAYSDFLEK